MSNLFKKALGIFVEIPEGKQPEEQAGQAEGEAPAAEAVQPLPDAPEDLTGNPDVQRAQEAIKLLASLPLADIPVAKARELIKRTLEFAGMEPEELQASFQRAQALYAAQIDGEKERIATRQQQNRERLQLLDAAMAEEKQQCEAELSARNARVEAATAGLSEIAKATAFFAPELPGGQSEP